MTRIILFLLKCLVGLLATVGFLLVAAVVAAALLIPRFEGLMPQLAAVPEQAVLVLDLSEGLIERRPDRPLARASLGGTLVLRAVVEALDAAGDDRSEEPTSELQSLMRSSYAVSCLKKKTPPT